jgi:hypothetical protein
MSAWVAHVFHGIARNRSTVEVNPSDLTAGHLAALRRAARRLSFRVRTHTVRDPRGVVDTVVHVWCEPLDL